MRAGDQKEVTPRRIPAAAGALICAVVAAGCGLGPGESIGDVELRVTSEYGTNVLLERRVDDASESETAMRLLDRSTEISTAYGGRFVQSIDGLEGTAHGGRRHDWFFYVNGVESPVGAADYPLHGGYRVWWDYRDWTAAMRVPAVVGSYPEPFLHGYEGRRRPVQVTCRRGGSACGVVRSRLRAAAARGGGADGDPIRVLVGPWATVRGDDAAGLIERGPAYSGVFAQFTRSAGAWRLQPLDDAGRPDGPPVEAGLIAATRDGDEPPTWVVTGSGAAETISAAKLLRGRNLRRRYAVAAVGGAARAVPVP
jgi:Domain of unknown function (DUF4430)